MNPTFLARSVGLVLLLAPGLCFAHAPGLSTGHVRLLPGRIAVEWTFARADIESLVPLDTNGDGQISPEEEATAGPTLEKLAMDACALRVDDRLVQARAPVVRLDTTNNVHLSTVFDAPSSGTPALQSTLFNRLPRGHRQFITVLDPAGSVLKEMLLDWGLDTITLPENHGLEDAAGRPEQHTFADFLKLGVEHIVTGYDHLLFLFALLMMAPGFRQAAAIVTSFTLAHSITLGLATLDVVTIPGRIVEPLIAASIVYVGLENLLKPGAMRGRWRLTFVFGLIHGFGFAGVLRELGVGSGPAGIALPLFSFNLGVEAGQIAIAALALPALFWARRFPAFIQRAAPASSWLVLALGGWWLVERIV